MINYFEYLKPTIILIEISVAMIIYSQFLIFLFKYVSNKSNVLKNILILILAPGIIIHELCHLIAIAFGKVKLEKVNLIDVQNSTIGGFVKFNITKNIGPISSFFICFIPTIFASYIIYYYNYLYFIISYKSILSYILTWIYISIYMFCGTSFHDILNFFKIGFKNISLVIRDIILAISSILIYTLIYNYIPNFENLPLIAHWLNIFLIYIALLLIYNVKIFVRKISKLESKLIQLRNPEFINKNKEIERINKSYINIGFNKNKKRELRSLEEL